METAIGVEDPPPDRTLYRPLFSRIEYLQDKESYPSLMDITNPDEEIDEEDLPTSGGESIRNANADIVVSNSDTIRNALNFGKPGKQQAEPESGPVYEWQRMFTPPASEQETDTEPGAAAA